MAKFDLNKYKASIQTADVPLKKDSYIEVNDALKEVMGLPGIPISHTTQIYGRSNGGKSTLGFHIAAQAQKQGILPIFVITEGKMSNERVEKFGVNLDTSIVESATYIEDVFKALNKHLASQASGDLPMDILFIVDSIGNTMSETSIKHDKDGNIEVGGAMMKLSRILRENMRILSHKINDTRKVNSPKTATLVFINHSYKVPPAFPGGPTTEVPYGGDGIYYSSTLVIKVNKTKYLKATKGGKDFTFGIVSKIAVEKNHVNGVSNSGDFLITPDSIIPNEPGALKDYKALNSDSWGSTTITTDSGEVLDEA